ncbi:MAG: RluA family pseudouridine synthase, partial [Lachnospiraceae bacterium]|nr:RluA family pseudouridine synthase [Lachnospiraceae bacterium]
LKTGASVMVSLPESVPLEAVPQNIPLDILYEDEDLLVVNKPKGMVVHPSSGHPDGTLVNAVLFHCGESLSGINGVLRPGIVHRIDKDTSGSLIICKNDLSHESIASQLKQHRILRKYHAIAHGIYKEDSITISKPLGRDPKDRLKISVQPGGKSAVTHARVLEAFPSGSNREAYSYIECVLETGRTHQIRVHMASIGHPLLGDLTYCPESLLKKEGILGKNCEGQCLHAKYLSFLHPRTGKTIEIDTPLPEYFMKALESLRRL